MGSSSMKGLSKAEATNDAMARMQLDPDIQQEKAAHLVDKAGNGNVDGPPAAEQKMTDTNAEVDIPLGFRPGQGGHRPTSETRRILRQVGGLEVIRKFTNQFYVRAFADPHLDQFIRDHDDPHGARFANWIAEKFGDETMPWTRERRTRKICPFHSHGHQFETAFDRSSAHYAAWHSPKRPATDFGRHFNLQDARVWMRLHFWAAREMGVFQHKGFYSYYVKFIGHFVSVYESTATQFARESARWSADPKNIEKYISNGNHMGDCIGVGLSSALKCLPPDERGGSWPYAY